MDLDIIAQFAEEEAIARTLAAASGDPAVKAVHERNADDAAARRKEAEDDQRREALKRLIGH